MKKVFISLCAYLFFGITTLAIPADPRPIEMKQPDGTSNMFKMVGVEYAVYDMTTDGIPVVRDTDGFFRYAELSPSGKFKAGSVIARNVESRTNSDNIYLTALPSAETYSQEFEAQRLAVKQETLNNATSRAGQTTGDVKGLVILVQFSDEKFTYTQSDFNNMMNQEGYNYDGAIGSARDYFIAQSGGAFRPTFDVYGPFTLDNNEAYYGGDGSNGAHDPNFNDRLPQDACDAANSTIDFSQYDADGDGKVDLIYFIYAGYAQSSSGYANDIWPKSGQATVDGVFSFQKNRWDGKTISYYACSSELKGKEGGTRSGIATFIHEYSHTLGLPDFYDTVSGATYGMGYWDIMCYGSYTGIWGVGYTAYERAFCGWINLEELPSTPTSILLRNLDIDKKAYRMSSSDSNQYFILENRQKTGWDSYLPASGLMITKIDYDSSSWNPYGAVGTANRVNVDPNRQRMTIMPADNLWSFSNEYGDLFPYNSNNSFTKNSTPASVTNTAGTIDKPITNIVHSNGVITFDVNGGNITTPTIQSITDDGTSVLINWNQIAGAASYNINVTRVAIDSNESAEFYKNVNVLETSYSFFRLPRGYTYIMQVQAVKNTGETSAFSTSKSITLIPADAAAVPTAFPADEMTATSFKANWQEIITGCVGYVIKVWRTTQEGISADGDGWPKEIQIYSGYTTSYQFNDLDLNTYVYYYQVKSVNSDDVGSAYSNTIRVDLVPNYYTVNFSESSNGSFEILKEGNPISSGTEVLEGTSLTIASYPDDGYQLESIIVNDNNISENTFIVTGTTTVAVTFSEIPSAQYITPEGTIHNGNTTYVKRIYTENADENIDQEWNSAPTSVYQIVDGTILLKPNASFNLHLIAYNLGDVSIVRQDLRYTRAFIFTDWDRDGTFTQEHIYGIKSPAANVAANYSSVMTINHNFTVPSTANFGESRIRIIYHNAWEELNNGGNSTNIKEGMAYDVVVKVVNPSSIDNINTDETVISIINRVVECNQPFTIYSIDGRTIPQRTCLSPGIYIIKTNSTTHKIVIQ